MSHIQVEGESSNMPPLLVGTENYDLWRLRMKVILSRNPLEWLVIKDGPFTFLDENGKPKDVDDLTGEELIKASYNGNAKYTLICGLSDSDFGKVSSCITAKEIWDTLKMHYQASTKLDKVCINPKQQADCHKQQAASTDKKKFKAQMTCNDDATTSGIELKEDMNHLALVGLNVERLQHNTEEILLESDVSNSESDASEVNSFYSNETFENTSLEQLTVQEHSNVTMEEFLAIKAEYSKLKEKNAHLKKVVSDLMFENVPENTHDEVSDRKAKVTQLEGLNKVIVKRNDALQKEVSKLKADIEARYVCLETFNIDESTSDEPSQHSETTNALKLEIETHKLKESTVGESSQQAEMVSQQAIKIEELEQEINNLQKEMGKFVQGKEVLKSMMKQTKAPSEKEILGIASTSKDKALKYDGKFGIPYDYAMPWRICNKCGKKGHFSKYCKIKNADPASWNRQTTYRQQAGRTKRTRNQAPKVVQKWVKKSDLNSIYVLATNHAGMKQVWVPKR